MKRIALFFLTLALSGSDPALAAPTLTTLVSIDTKIGPNIGLGPSASLIADAAGNLYGTTVQGGAFGIGAVFRVAAGTNELTTLASFNGINGDLPWAGLMADADGNLYGTTASGGASGVGAVFRVAAGTNELTTLASFNGGNGANPFAGLIADADGNLYGTTSFGGPNVGGTVFRVAAGTHALTTLASFNGINGAGPSAGLIADAAGNLYGTTVSGGASGVGAVFRVAAGTNELTTLASFDGSNGADPFAGLIADAAGNLYGTTAGGGAFNSGAVFRVAAGTHALTTLASFDGANGANPYAELIADAAGNLYGTTASGGASGVGVVFRVAAGTNELTTLASFNGSNGASPRAGLIADAAGNLYGTTFEGGAFGSGTVFRLSDAGFVVPEPATCLLTALAASGFAMLRGRRSQPFRPYPN